MAISIRIIIFDWVQINILTNGQPDTKKHSANARKTRNVNVAYICTQKTKMIDNSSNDKLRCNNNCESGHKPQARDAMAVADYIDQVGHNKPFPVKVTHPPITENSKEWRDYMKGKNFNLPHQFHNGGIWPFVGGWYVVALSKAKRYKEAKVQLLALAEANMQGKAGEWEFSEWIHGGSGKPMGREQQLWSAAMFLYALNVCKLGEK